MLPLDEVVARIRGQGGLVYVPHPFDPVRSSLGPALTSLCAGGGADVIEVFNAKIAASTGRPGSSPPSRTPGSAASTVRTPSGIRGVQRAYRPIRVASRSRW
ncbi:MAG TPA: hypothetical protein VK817_18330 [Trebonia sp.]|nr:hypothetical protein [Trebonia sp.]